MLAHRGRAWTLGLYLVLSLLCVSYLQSTGAAPARQRDGNVQKRGHESSRHTKPQIIHLPSSKLFDYGGAEAVRPAVEAVLTKKLFDMAGRVGAQILTKDLKNVPVPDFDAVLDIPMLGNCDFIFRNGTLNWVAIGEDLTYVELTNNFLTGHLGNVSFEVEMDFRYTQQRWPHVKSHGHAIMHGLGGNLTAITTFYVGETGAVQLFVLDSSTTFDQITIDISDSKAAWLYNAVTGLFRQKVQGDVETKLNEEVHKTLPDAANQLFDTMPKTVPVLGSLLNVSFVPPIYVSPSHAVAHIYGLFQSEAGACPYSSLSPFTAGEAAWPISRTSAAHMLTFNLHKSIGQCFLWSLTRSGFLNRRIDCTATPSAPAEILTTATWAKIIPAVADVFGADNPVSIDVYPTQGEPHLRVSPMEGIVASIAGLRVSVFAFDNPTDTSLGAPRTLIVSLDMAAEVAASPAANADGGQIVFGLELEDADLDATLVRADERLGEIDMERVNLAFKAALGSASEQLQQLIDDNPVVVPRIPFIDILKAEASLEESLVSLSVDVGYNGM
ncbi:hypothetical protein M427DRAFT_137147 [Gonapodya prolifera JEL478]|uniref:Lipid-binding serum glycoprotein C-terminal domain-containing protein n=1 Tax=Gonapodya prolifera (strain JEL478) TaxID=1344416 RepID=A0A139A722_GONPJ|nr:hypothetical protein M427DRAFT_137147 [Gonapodya prolifera JEL478]|eukprot:KXS12626.1 hypothetical protein M427DRAFT_137147 [Gonapodya prolifera JEL478]